MPKPIKHRELLRRLRALGWDGPYQEGKHPFMVRGQTRLTIPNPHAGDIDWSLTKRILRTAGIRPDEWDKV
jgi:predicted RNA binding protein YcfA (HicA-like mRNA interferase family)